MSLSSGKAGKRSRDVATSSDSFVSSTTEPRSKRQKSAEIAASTSQEGDESDDWAKFLEDRFYDESELEGSGNKTQAKDAADSDKKWWKGEWKPPKVRAHWERGPIALAMDWWQVDVCTTDAKRDSGSGKLVASADSYWRNPMDAIFAKAQQRADGSMLYGTSAVSKSQSSQLRQESKKGKVQSQKESSHLRKSRSEAMAKAIRKDLTKERTRQKLQKALVQRIEHGEKDKILADGDAEAGDASDPFVSFFDAAIDEFRAMRGLAARSSDDDEDEETKRRRSARSKEQLRRSERRKVRQIASLAKDSLFYVESDDDCSDDDAFDDPIVVGGNHSHRKHFTTNTDETADALFGDHMADETGNSEGTDELSGDGVATKKPKSGTRISMSELVDEKNEKRALKELNIMDFVVTYKDSFWRQVSEMNLNLDALIGNWKLIRKHEGVSRKLKRKLGILMARENAKRKRKAAKTAVDEMIQETGADCDLKVLAQEIAADSSSESVDDSSFSD